MYLRTLAKLFISGGIMIKNMFKDLSNFINQNKLIEQAFEDFNFAFNKWKMDSPEHYNNVFGNKTIECMNVFVHEVSIRFSEWPECDIQHVVITIIIHDANFYIGEYNWFYPISENATPDDFFQIL